MRVISRVRKSGYRLFFVILSPLVATLFLLILVLSLNDALRVDRNEGLRGRYTVTEVQAGGPRVSGETAGTFSSYDGTLTLKGVSIDGGARRVGDVIEAQYVADSWSGSGVFPLDPHAARSTLLLALAPLGWMVVWSWKVLVAPSRRRRMRVAASCFAVDTATD